MLRIFIGYDPRQPVAYNVLAHSVASRASKPVSIVRLQLSQLTPFTRRGLTEFTYSRYLVPYLSEYEGWSVFLDADMLCLGDIHELVAYAERDTADIVGEWAAQNDTNPSGPSLYVVKNARRFEWPSMMVFRNALCRTLTPEWVQDPKNDPYRLEWVASTYPHQRTPKWTDGIGELPAEWNQLVHYDPPNPNAKLIHFTQGIPCWPETAEGEFSEQWVADFRNMKSTVPFKDLMGKSVHAKPVAERLARQAVPA